MPRFEASSDTRFLAQALETTKPGDIATFEALSSAIGRDVRKFAFPSLQSALRMQVNEGRVFESIRGVGYQRLTDSDIVKTQAAKGLAHISRVARKTSKKILASSYDNLSNREKIDHNTQLSMLGAVGHLSKPSAMKLLTEHVTNKGAELAIGDTLKLMTK